MNICKKLAKVLGYFIVITVLSLVASIKCIIKGESLAVRMVIALCHAGLISAAVFKPIVFFFLLVIILVAELAFSIYTIALEEKLDYSAEDTENEEYSVKGSFFAGMTLEDAKREYRRLMKQYHPDNQGGNLEMTKIISEAYREHCTFFAR